MQVAIDALAVLLSFALNVAVAHATGVIARRRGRSFRVWIWIGAIFGPFGLLAAVLLPRRWPRNPSELAA